MGELQKPGPEKIDPLTPLGRRVLNEIKARNPDPTEAIGPGWSNGVAELRNPVELGWRLVAREVELDDPNSTTGGW